METTISRVEFFGLPGAGKTYLTDQLFEQNPALIPYVLPNVPATWKEKVYDFPFFWQHIGIMRKARREQTYPELLTRFRRIARRRPYIRRHHRRLLIECGLLQPALEAFLLWQTERTAPNWETFLRRALLPGHHYILITEQPEASADREYNRERRRFTFPKDILEKKYEQAQILIARIKKEMHCTEFDRSTYRDTGLLLEALHQQISKFLNLEHVEKSP